MKSKKGQSRNTGELLLGAFIAVCIVALIFYFLAHVAFWIGIAGIIISIILFTIGNEEGKKFGLIILLASIILLLVGTGIIHFFNNNEIGKTTIEGGKAIVDYGKNVANMTKLK